MYWSLKPYVLGKCSNGFINLENDPLKCVECPMNFMCSNNTILGCLDGTSSIVGSSTCCPKNATCPVGYAVDTSNGCKCKEIKCPSVVHFDERNKMIFKSQNLVFEKRDISIKCLSNNICMNCIKGNLIVSDTSTCECSKYDECIEKYNGNYWTGNIINKFVCTNFFKKSYY